MSSGVSSAIISQRSRKRLRTLTKSTPWKDSYELNAVGRSLLLAARLFSATTEQRQQHNDHATTLVQRILTDDEQTELYHALIRVNMWKARSDQGRIPHSMDTTFALAQVAWRDYYCSSSGSMELRMAYAVAIMRGVNGLADALQQNRAYAASVASLCDQLGLPGWLVDVRHETAHNDLPSLSVLRLAAKTFLGFLEERYWQPLAHVRHDARQNAVQLLVKYKEACKKNNSAVSDDVAEEVGVVDTNDTNASSSSSDEESEADNDDSAWGKSLGTNNNRFAIFLDESPPKHKVTSKKRRRQEASNKQQKEPNANSDSKQAVHSALHFARVFVRDVPIDVGYQVALSFLVWGGMGEAPAGRGVLIPGSPTSFPASAEGIQRIRNRYKPLILVLSKAWPGFVPALLIHLVDHVISIEATATSAGDDLLDDAGSQRKLFFLSSWIHFLVSREFHLQTDVTVGMYGKDDLSKKSCAKWTMAESDFMEKPAPYAVLSRAGLPLNSLCDRCFDGSSKTDHTNGSYALGVNFRDILEKDRVSNHGLVVLAKGARALQEGKDIVSESSTAGRLSVDELEKMLAIETNQEASAAERMSTASAAESTCGEASSVPSHSAVTSPWSLCAAWDACAIGSLPGRPV